jgi:LysM repeat protein
MPGVIGYIVKAKDDLWSLAKKYRTTKESIMEVNELEDENLKVGERILIFRENMSIL